MSEINFLERDNCYYALSYKNTNKIEIKISNFVMKILYMFPDGTDNATRILQIENDRGIKDILEICSSDFAINKFKAAIRSRGNFSFTGIQINLDHILEHLQYDEVVAQKVSVLGYQPESKCYAFSNGLLDIEGQFHAINDFGIVEHKGKGYYLPALSIINKYADSHTNEKNNCYEKGNMNFTEFSQHLINAYGNNGIICISFLINAVFRDIIYQELGFYPFLYLFGGAGKGKSSLAKLLLSLFTRNPKEISLEGDSTSKAFARIISQFRNGLFFFTEYTNNIDNRMTGFLKGIYDGIGYDRAQMTNDNRTHKTPVLSAIILDGNEMPVKKSALFSRTILLDFTANSFSEEETASFKKLENEKQNGFAKVLSEIFAHRLLFENNFKKIFYEAYDTLKFDDDVTKGLDERSIRHLAFLLTPLIIIDSQSLLPFPLHEAYTCIIKNAVQQNELMNEIKEVQVFWKSIEYLCGNNRISNDDFTIRHDGICKKLFLNYNKVYPLYNEYCRRQGMNVLDQASLIQLLKSEKYFIPGSQKGRGASITVKNIGSTYCFIYDQLNIDLENRYDLQNSIFNEKENVL